MALPQGGPQFSWPPLADWPSYGRYAEWAAWFAGEPAGLERFYAGIIANVNNSPKAQQFFDQRTTAQPMGTWWRKYAFWARQDPGSNERARYHVPIAGDICSTSADLLFSDPPDTVIPEAHAESAPAGAKACQDALNAGVANDGMLATFNEMAEVSAGLGGGFLRVVWDPSFIDHPMLNGVHPDAAVPEFRWGRLSAVTFHRIVKQENGRVWRHLERHEKGRILHGLYMGDPQYLGDPVPLTDAPETADITVDDGAGIDTGLDLLTAVYVPNLRTNRTNRSSFLGRSDYAGVEGLMDALDEVFTSWMRDFRIGKGRLLVPLEMLMSLGKGQGAGFDIDREVYEALDYPPTAENPIKNIQFNIRTQEHLVMAENLLERIVASSGYSATTFGLASRQAAATEKTATEVKAREHRSLVTRGRKQQYWQAALSDILYVWLQVNEREFKGPTAFRPRIDFPDTVHESSIDIANSIALLRGVKVISLITSIKRANPDWDPEEVKAEVVRLQEEDKQAAQVTSPAPTDLATANAQPGPGGGPAGGAPEGPPPGGQANQPPPAQRPAPATNPNAPPGPA